MIINLVGHIAAGKSTFANWWTIKYPSWTIITIDSIRKKYPVGSEDLVWEDAQKTLMSIQGHCIFESTGTIWRLKNLWNQELVNRGIYTIKFVISPREAKMSARQRAILEGSNRYIDECYEIDLDKENQDKLCCNLIINGGITQVNDEIYREAEQYILRAKTVFYYNRQNIILGQNYFKK